MKNGRWSTPVNIGYPLNTTDDDLFFTPLVSGNRGYFSKFSGDGQGRMDIYSCEIWSEQNPRDAALNKAELYPRDAALNKAELYPRDAAVNMAEQYPHDAAINEAAVKSVKPVDPAGEIAAADTLTLQGDYLPDCVKIQACPDATDPVSYELYEKTDSLAITDSSVTGPLEKVEEEPADVTASDVTPLYKEIPVKAAGENVQGAASDKPSVTTASNDAADEADAIEATVSDDASVADINGNEEDIPPGPDSGKGCCLCWLLALTALLFFFLVWRRRKKKKENDVQ